MKRKILLIIISILILTLSVLGITYAFMRPQVQEDQTETNISIKTCAKIQLKDNGTSINLESTFPMDDDMGLETEPYEFTVSSTCEEYVGFNLYLTSLNDNQIEDNNIHFAITNPNKDILKEGILNDQENVTSDFDDEEINQLDIGIKGTHKNIYKVYSDDLPFQGESNYQLYLWLDKDASNETMGQTFRAGVSIKSYNQAAKFVKDLSGKGNHGKAINIVKWDDEGITTSDANNIGYINCGLEGYNFYNSVSLIVRVKINEFTDNTHQRLFNNYVNYDGGASGTGLACANKHPYISSWALNTNGWKHNQSSKVLQENNWYTIVGTYDGNDEKLYVNGVLEATIPFVDNIKVSPGPFYIGKSSMESKDYTLTTFTDALIFDRALTEEEISRDYSEEINPINKQDLLLWYKFN